MVQLRTVRGNGMRRTKISSFMHIRGLDNGQWNKLTKKHNMKDDVQTFTFYKSKNLQIFGDIAVTILLEILYVLFGKNTDPIIIFCTVATSNISLL